MADPELSPIQVCGRELLTIKDEIHAHWSNAQKFYTQWTDAEQILYPVPRIETNLVLEAARRALGLAKECGSKADIIERIERIREGLFSKLVVTDEERIGLKAAYIFPSKEEANDFLFEEVGFNGLANAVHDAGYDMLQRQPTPQYAGCKVEGKDLDEYVMKFCEGSTPRDSWYLGNGKIEAHLGSHRAVIKMRDLGPRVRGVTLDYNEGGYRCSETRLDSIAANLEEGMDFDCETDTYVLKCEGRIEDPKDAKKLGSFLFGVRDMDIWRFCECTDDGVSTAFEKAEKSAEQEGWTPLDKIALTDTDCFKEALTEEQVRKVETFGSTSAEKA